MIKERESFNLQDEDDSPVDFHAALDGGARLEDDCVLDPKVNLRMHALMEAITHVGGEVSRIRAEMDGLLEQNESLLETFSRLKEFLAEKGTINLEDFDLACEVMDAKSVPLSKGPLRKLAN